MRGGKNIAFGWLFILKHVNNAKNPQTSKPVTSSFMHSIIYNFDCFFEILGSVNEIWSDIRATFDERFQHVFSSIP